MPQSAPTKKSRKWALQLLVLVLVTALGAFALSLAEEQRAPTATQNSGTKAPTHVEQPQTIDLRDVERRKSSDLLSDGPVDAPVALIVFSDYQCPFCAKWSTETLPVMRDYAQQGKLRIEWRDVNVFGSDSTQAALATYAAAQQDAFWHYHDALFANGQTRKGADLSAESLIELAGDLGLDVEQFSTDLTSSQAKSEIAANAQLGLDLGATSTPVFLLDGQPLVGAQPTDVFVQALEAALATGE